MIEADRPRAETEQHKAAAEAERKAGRVERSSGCRAAVGKRAKAPLTGVSTRQWHLRGEPESYPALRASVTDGSSPMIDLYSPANCPKCQKP
jgi:hypothetical protein